jgi:hypothetical protein
MPTENELIQKRLNEVQAKINFLTLEKERNDKERKLIEEELKKLGISSQAELETLIKQKEESLALMKNKFDAALTKLEEKTNDLESKVRNG